MYNKVGNFNQEYYRFGVVFIYQNGTLSNVYNTLGRTISSDEILTDAYNNYPLYSEINDNKMFLRRNYISIDDFGWISDTHLKNTIEFANARGVCKINSTTQNDNKIFGIKFNNDEVSSNN